MGSKAFVFYSHNQFLHRRQVFLIYPALKYLVQAKWTNYWKLYENLQKKINLFSFFSVLKATVLFKSE